MPVKWKESGAIPNSFSYRLVKYPVQLLGVTSKISMQTLWES